MFKALNSLIAVHKLDIADEVRQVANRLNPRIAYLWPKAQLRTPLAQWIKIQLEISPLHNLQYHPPPQLPQLLITVINDLCSNRYDRSAAGNDESRTHIAARLFDAMVRASKAGKLGENDSDGASVAVTTTPPAASQTSRKRQRVGVSSSDLSKIEDNIAVLTSALSEIGESSAPQRILTDILRTLELEFIPELLSRLLCAGKITNAVLLLVCGVLAAAASPTQGEPFLGMVLCEVLANVQSCSVLPPHVPRLVTVCLTPKLIEGVPSQHAAMVIRCVCVSIQQYELTNGRVNVQWHDVWRCGCAGAVGTDSKVRNQAVQLLARLLWAGYTPRVSQDEISLFPMLETPAISSLEIDLQFAVAAVCCGEARLLAPTTAQSGLFPAHAKQYIADLLGRALTETTGSVCVQAFDALLSGNATVIMEPSSTAKTDELDGLSAELMLNFSSNAEKKNTLKKTIPERRAASSIVDWLKEILSRFCDRMVGMAAELRHERASPQATQAAISMLNTVQVVLQCSDLVCCAVGGFGAELSACNAMLGDALVATNHLMKPPNLVDNALILALSALVSNATSIYESGLDWLNLDSCALSITEQLRKCRLEKERGPSHSEARHKPQVEVDDFWQGEDEDEDEDMGQAGGQLQALGTCSQGLHNSPWQIGNWLILDIPNMLGSILGVQCFTNVLLTRECAAHVVNREESFHMKYR